MTSPMAHMMLQIHRNLIIKTEKHVQTSFGYNNTNCSKLKKKSNTQSIQKLDFEVKHFVETEKRYVLWSITF